MTQREPLLARIRQVRRGSKTDDEAAHPPTIDPERDPLRALEVRIEHLEKLVQGLQDSVHRESLRHEKRLSAVEAQIEPGALGKALSDDARERGL